APSRSGGNPAIRSNGWGLVIGVLIRDEIDHLIVAVSVRTLWATRSEKRCLQGPGAWRQITGRAFSFAPPPRPQSLSVPPLPAPCAQSPRPIPSRLCADTSSVP